MARCSNDIIDDMAELTYLRQLKADAIAEAGGVCPYQLRLISIVVHTIQIEHSSSFVRFR